MNSISCGKGLLIFSMTFVLGIFFTLVVEQTELPQTKMRPEILTPALNKTLPSNQSNLKCAEMIGKDMELYKLLRERLDLEIQIESWGVIAENEKQLKIYKKKLKKINQQIEKLEREIKEGKFKWQESSGTHNLLYIENCVEY